MNEQTKNSDTATELEAGARIDPILNHLEVPGANVDKSKIRERFVQLWDFEEGDKLSPVDQHLTTIALFMYCSHLILDDYNIRVDRAREFIVSALEAWQKPEIDEMVEREKSSENPFKAFVESNVPKIDEIYTWENFLLEHKQADETQWTYKMKKCWFTQFFIRFGRTDLIETACLYDQIPWKARKDYVDLKLNNLFRKLGNFCQFTYRPSKPGK